MILFNIENNNTWVNEFFQYFIAPFIVAAISYFLFGLNDEYKKRKKYSILGFELISTLIEEVETGLKIINKTLEPNFHGIISNLPHKSWNGISTIQDEILLRIFEVSKGKPIQGFPAIHIRIHLKNYFEHIIPNWEKIHLVNNPKEAAKSMSNYAVDVNNVLLMLVHVRSLLEHNANQLRPK